MRDKSLLAFANDYLQIIYHIYINKKVRVIYFFSSLVILVRHLKKIEYVKDILLVNEDILSYLLFYAM